jgi:hypothetical protein
MTRNALILACVAGLTVSPLAGCSRALVDKNPQSLAQADPVTRGDPAGLNGPVSPYNPRSAGLPAEPKKDTLEPIHHTEFLPSRTGVPPAAPSPATADLPAAPLPAPTEPPAKPAPDPRPEPAEEPLLAALRCLLHKHPAEAVKWLERYDKPNQELLLCLLPLAARLTEDNLDQASPQYLATVLEQLSSLSRPLRSRAALSIEKLCFCREIKGYGLYEPLPDDHAFRTGSDSRPGEMVQVYVEVRNFVSEPQGPFHLTRLASSLQICDLKGNVVWRHAFPDARAERDWGDRSRTPRTDYFINFNFWMPQLPPGYYTLWVQVEDVLTKPHRMDRRSLDFKVGAGGISERRTLDETGEVNTKTVR